MLMVQYANNPFDQVVDVAHGTRLRAVACDGDGLIGEGLSNEGRDGSTVVGAHSLAEGVEDSNDAGIHPVGAAVCHRHRLGEPLGLVVDTARTHRVDVSPVRLGLLTHVRVAVHL
jgi:hypothetical protein